MVFLLHLCFCFRGLICFLGAGAAQRPRFYEDDREKRQAYLGGDLESTGHIGGAQWLKLQSDGNVYSEEQIKPKQPSKFRWVRYMYNGLLHNELNKWNYLEFRGELSFVQKKLSAMHAYSFEMDSRRELHYENMLDKEGAALDAAVDAISKGFVQRMIEDVALICEPAVVGLPVIS